MRRTFYTLVALTMITGIAACGDDDDGTDDALGDACGRVEAATAVGVFDGESATSDDVAAWATALVDEYRPLADGPDGFSEPATRLVEALDQVAEDGDRDLITEDVLVDQQALAGEATEQCGFQVVEVDLADYSFEGLPATVDAGMTSFQLTGAGDEEHELQLARLSDEFTGSLDELLSSDDAFSLFDPYIGAGFCAPGECARGEVGYLLTSLTPGRYVAFCTLPVAGGGEDDPHLAHGMISLMEVR